MKETTKKKVIEALLSYRYQAKVLSTDRWWIGVDAKIGNKVLVKTQALTAFTTFCNFTVMYIDAIDKSDENILSGYKNFNAVEDDSFYIGGAVALLHQLNRMLEPLSIGDRREITREMYKLTSDTVVIVNTILEVE